VVAITAAHALLIALAWHGAVSSRHETAPARRMMMRLLAAPRPAVVAAPVVAKAVEAPARKVAVSQAAPVVPAAPTPAPAPAPEPTPEPVTGAAFGMPTFGFGGPPPSRWAGARHEAASPPVDMSSMLRQQAEAAQNAERARMAATLACEADETRCP
jgi:hypothetical protein